MPDITSELNIIANEPKGREVKEAIWRALNMINDAADRRPSAKIGVPVGEAYIDTGFINHWVAGDFQPGEIGSVLGTISAGVASGESYLASISDFVASGKGRLILVCLSGWNDQGSPPTVHNTGDEVTWTQVGTYEVPMRIQNGQGNALIHFLYPDKTISVKGTVDTSSGLPSSGMSDGDVYICKEDNRVYLYDSDTSDWIHPEAQSQVILNNEIDRRLTVWTASVESFSTIGVYVGHASIAEELSLGLFFAYDKGSFTPSEMDVRPCLVNNGSFSGVKTISRSGYTYKGDVMALADLPENPDAGDRYYVTSLDKFYAYVDGEWSWDGTVYNVYTDSIDNKDTGYHPFTSSKPVFFIIVTIDPVGNFTPILCPAALTDQEYLTCHTAASCTMNAFVPKTYASFLPYRTTEDYYWLYNGSIAVMPIEFVEGGE